MCITCGCSEGAEVTLTHIGTHEDPAEHRHVLADGTVISHTHDHTETHAHHHHTQTDKAAIHAQTHHTTLTLEQNLLAKNDQLAAQNRAWFQEQEILGLNLVSSPGSGKTTLLTRTIRDLQEQIPISVIEGDQATSNDAQRIRETGCNVVQINTGTGCHLEAAMIQKGLQELAPAPRSMVMIENVGNLVCPALFDLGEQAKVVILSVTEGEDKPMKYPHMFRASQVMILTKIDLLPYVEFDRDRCVEYALKVNPELTIFQVSATTGEGVEDWYDWLKNTMRSIVKKNHELMFYK